MHDADQGEIRVWGALGDHIHDVTKLIGTGLVDLAERSGRDIPDHLDGGDLHVALIFGEGVSAIANSHQRDSLFINPLIRCVQAQLQGFTLGDNPIEGFAQYVLHWPMTAFAVRPRVVLCPGPAVTGICLAGRAEVNHFWLAHFEPLQLSVPV